MMLRSYSAYLRQSLPLIVFAAVVIVLCLTALMSFSDLVSSRIALSSESELLEKLKTRAANAKDNQNFQSTDYVFEFPSHGLAAAEFQRRISDVLSERGADLQLSEVIPPDPEGDVGRLAIAINFEVDDTRLIDLMHAIENAKPALVIERLSIRTGSGAAAQTTRRLQATATIISGWRPAP